MKSTRPLLLAALLVVTLGACSRDEPERPPTNTVEEMGEPTPEPSPTPSAEPTRIPAPDASVQSNAIDELADIPAEPDAQMMDDAAATGMTARAPRDEPASQDAPAEPVEQK